MVKIKKLTFLLVIPIFTFLVIFLSCKNIQMRIDQYGLNDNADFLLNEFKSQTQTKISSREEVEKFISNYSLLNIKNNLINQYSLTSIQAMHKKDKWKVRIFNKHFIVPTVYKFSLNHPMRKIAGPTYFYLWQVAPIKNNKSLIWIPGMGVSDFAFNFIYKLIIAALEKGYNVALYIPPMHLERITKGKEAGEGFFTADIKHNYLMMDLSVSEVYTLSLFLKRNQSLAISGWGGSIGATILLLSAQLMQYEQLTVMIPVLDMNDLLINNDSMKKVVHQYSLQHFDKSFLQMAYQKISPIHFPIPVSKEKILIQYGKYDQLVSPQTVLKFAKQYQLKNVIGYDRSHATILINDKLYEDYRLFQK